jgi:hypothetical protein
MMQFRGIDLDHVKKAMKNPDSTEEAYDGKMKAIKRVDKERSVTVIYSREGFKDANDYVIVTAYYTSND